MQSAGKKFFGRAHPLVWTKGTISRFGERFRDGQYSLAMQLLVCCSAHGARALYGVGATVCGYALRSSDKSLTLTALTRLFGSGLPHTSLICFNPLPPFF